jgi:hypothetical protein
MVPPLFGGSMPIRVVSRLLSCGFFWGVLSGCFEASVAIDSRRSTISVKSCNLEGMLPVTAQEWSTPPGKIVFRGWAYDGTDNTVPDVVRVQLALSTGSVIKLSSVATRVERADVGNHFKDTRLLRAGFEAVLDGNQLIPGNYQLSIAQYTESTQIVCETTRVLTIK